MRCRTRRATYASNQPMMYECMKPYTLFDCARKPGLSMKIATALVVTENAEVCAEILACLHRSAFLKIFRIATNDALTSAL